MSRGPGTAAVSYLHLARTPSELREVHSSSQQRCQGCYRGAAAAPSAYLRVPGQTSDTMAGEGEKRVGIYRQAGRQVRCEKASGLVYPVRLTRYRAKNVALFLAQVRLSYTISFLNMHNIATLPTTNTVSNAQESPKILKTRYTSIIVE